MLGFPLFPEQASSIAGRVDALYYFLLGVSLFFASLIFLLIIYFAVRYRRRSEDEQPRPITADIRLEVAWSVIPLALTMVMFAWGARLFFVMRHPPADALEIYVVGKQWMWKFQHPEGMREINELHVPVGRAVKLTLASEDVIHSMFVPAFRVKQDAVPGRYTTVWFEATKTGRYRLFCAEYCGTQHSGMIGRVVVMAPAAYERWLGGGVSEISLADAGRNLFERLGCSTCHLPADTGRGPSLVGLMGSRVRLKGGGSVVADAGYIRESMVQPNAKIVAGYPPVMPTFKGLIGEEGILQIVAYIGSLKEEERKQVQR
ncbi:MAG: cytochrome c oxidase subunit II [Candidatus Binatia bacterium]